MGIIHYDISLLPKTILKAIDILLSLCMNLVDYLFDISLKCQNQHTYDDSLGKHYKLQYVNGVST